MAGKEIRIYGEDESAIKIRPYEHHAKYYETDQMGIVHHSNYIRWFEEARCDLQIIWRRIADLEKQGDNQSDSFGGSGLSENGLLRRYGQY